MALRWKRQADCKGLALVCQGPRGFELCLDGVRIASAAYLGRSQSKAYWSCATSQTLGIPWTNTSNAPANSIEEAKDQAMAFIKPYVTAAIKSGAYVKPPKATK